MKPENETIMKPSERLQVDICRSWLTNEYGGYDMVVLLVTSRDSISGDNHHNCEELAVLGGTVTPGLHTQNA